MIISDTEEEDKEIIQLPYIEPKRKKRQKKATKKKYFGIINSGYLN